MALALTALGCGSNDSEEAATPGNGDPCDQTVADVCGGSSECIPRDGQHICVTNGEPGTSCTSERVQCTAGHCLQGYCSRASYLTFEHCELSNVSFAATPAEFEPVYCTLKLDYEFVNEAGDPCDEGDQCTHDTVVTVFLGEMGWTTDVPPGTLTLRLPVQGNEFVLPSDLNADSAEFKSRDGDTLGVVGPLSTTAGAEAELFGPDEPSVDLTLDFGGLLDGMVSVGTGAAALQLAGKLHVSGLLNAPRSSGGTGSGGSSGSGGSTGGGSGGATGSGSAGTSTLTGPSCTNPGGGWFCVDCEAESMGDNPYGLGTSDVQVWSQCAAACAYYDSSYGSENQGSDAQSNLGSMIDGACQILASYDPSYRSNCAYCP
jgi:hypothetical protein